MPRNDGHRLFSEHGKGKHRVWAEAVPAGQDVVIVVGGGERPHVGSLSLASAAHPPFSASVPGHKDYLVSSRAAARVSGELGRTCVVVVGIHIDNASKAEIELLMNNADRCLDLLIGALKNPRMNALTGPSA